MRITSNVIASGEELAVIARRQRRRSNLVMLAALLTAACSSDTPPAPQAAEPVVVYVAFEDNAALRERFDRYSDAAGVTVIDRRGATAAIVDDIIENRITPPADLLVTRSVVPAWHAAEESALRPVYTEALAAGLPEWAMDPDRLWFAMAADRAVIAYSGEPPPVTDVEELAGDVFRGELCLSSSQLVLNRAVIAGMLNRMAVRDAELAVRGWLANLARQPLQGQDELAAAIADGGCGVGVVSARAARRAGVSFIEPATLYADIEAVGVARHAHNPEGAAELAAWLVAGFDSPAGAPSGGANVSVFAQYHDDAVRLAERARYF